MCIIPLATAVRPCQIGKGHEREGRMRVSCVRRVSRLGSDRVGAKAALSQLAQWSADISDLRRVVAGVGMTLQWKGVEEEPWSRTT
ncbi:hypothetical protein LSTR_LSTR002980 [Laodelphax striatellus]|uniref:Uncharacterized protein n=1 Tax=Laodelphax striatellus TaxID=195883 RepID=A0A482WS59_LAOST|nr:hypothetical protein LSTR_LSTR002980 [Laodelphax striatellus]